MSTPFPSPITPYDNLKNSAVTPEWDVSIVKAHMYQGTIPPIRSIVTVVLRIKNKQKHSALFTCETFIYEPETQKKILINLSAVNARKEKINFTTKAKSIKELELFTREASPFMGKTTKWWTTFMLIIKLTDDTNHSVQLRASKLKINTAQ